MFYAIVDVIELPKDECSIFSTIRYNNTGTKVIVKIKEECTLAHTHTLYMEDYIKNIIQKNDEWKSKNIV